MADVCSSPEAMKRQPPTRCFKHLYIVGGGLLHEWTHREAEASAHQTNFFMTAAASGL